MLYKDDFELESRKVEFGFYDEDYFTMEDVIDPNTPKADLDYEDDLQF